MHDGSRLLGRGRAAAILSHGRTTESGVDGGTKPSVWIPSCWWDNGLRKLLEGGGRNLIGSQHEHFWQHHECDLRIEGGSGAGCTVGRRGAVWPGAAPSASAGASPAVP